ncbi:hypothetical protein Goshw_008575, partial [Gossypium schwendimanii]|nr:hypothetical protein [Gossypium schwendimanii]
AICDDTLPLLGVTHIFNCPWKDVGKQDDGERSFVEKNYKDLKTLNPKLPILIRECRGIEPQMWARYDMGVEKGIRLEGLSEPQILKALEDLAKAGASTKA